MVVSSTKAPFIPHPPRNRSSGAAPGGSPDAVTLSGYSLTSGLTGGVTMAAFGTVAAAAAPLLGANGGALAGGALFAVGVLKGDNPLLKGLGLAALGGTLCAMGAVILGAIPLACGLAMLAVEGLKVGG